MKKLFLFIMIFLYFGTSTGFTMHLHYCMDDLVQASLIEDEEENCSPSCEMDEEAKSKDDCCQDQEKQVKLEQAHKAADNAFMGMKNLAFSLPPSLFLIDFDLSIPRIAESNPLSNSPPVNLDIPVYLRNCSFLI